MTIEYIRYTLSTHTPDELLAGYATAVESLQAAPECLGYELTRCEEDEKTFTLRIHWASTEAHLQGFRKGPNFPPFLAAIKPFIPDDHRDAALCANAARVDTDQRAMRRLHIDRSQLFHHLKHVVETGKLDFVDGFAAFSRYVRAIWRSSRIVASSAAQSMRRGVAMASSLPKAL